MLLFVVFRKKLNIRILQKKKKFRQSNLYHMYLLLFIVSECIYNSMYSWHEFWVSLKSIWLAENFVESVGV